MTQLEDIPRNDAEAAFDYFKAEYKRTGKVSFETYEVLVRLQSSGRELRRRIRAFVKDVGGG